MTKSDSAHQTSDQPSAHQTSDQPPSGARRALPAGDGRYAHRVQWIGDAATLRRSRERGNTGHLAMPGSSSATTPVRSHRSEGVTRALNILIAATALAIILPLLILIALLVRLTSRGPILYTQIRVGVDTRCAASRRGRRERRSGFDRRADIDRRARFDRRATLERRSRLHRPVEGRRRENIGGHPFRIYKFRSMCVDAECRSGVVWATAGDSRVTTVGRVLRRSRLDEIPQLINVLKGEMNIVGPRPERPSIFCRLREEIPNYPLRQRARPGITGWAQIKQRYDTCMEDVQNKLRLDLEYLQRQDVWEDLKIMVKTIPVMLFRRGGW